MLPFIVGFVALQHLAFLVLEMFLWEKPVGRRTFGLSREQAAATASLAKNQGLYNGFLAAGLGWSLFAPPELARPLQLFFLGCVVVAGIGGAITVDLRILLVQGVPASLGLALLLLA